MTNSIRFGRSTSHPLILGVLIALALLSASAVRAQDDKKDATATEKATTLTLIGGGQYVNDVDARGKARLNEFREIPKGGVIEFGQLTWSAKDSGLHLAFTATDVAQKDQGYFLYLADPARFRFKAGFDQFLRQYSTGSKTLWSGVGTGRLTLDNAFRQRAEDLAGAPTNPFASPELKTYIEAALSGAKPFDIGTDRKDLKSELEFNLGKSITATFTGRYELRGGTKPLGFGTYIRRQGLAGTPGTGAGFFWRETVEARGSELIEPLDYKTTEMGAALTWTKKGHSLSAGWFGSRFRNDITALYFDNPFEASTGRNSASIFDPKADQETGAPNGNNNFRGLYDRSSTSLAPNNDYSRVFGNASVKLGEKARFTAVMARASMEQNDAFLPYAENDQVVFSQLGQPVVYAKNAALPRPSLDGKMETTQADFKLTARPTDGLGLRAAYRYYKLDDQRPHLTFPGYSSSGDSFFRAGVGQKDAAGNRYLFNEVGGYDRQRLTAGASYRFGSWSLDGEYAGTTWNYEARQVEKTTDNSFKGTLRVSTATANASVYARTAKRDFDGSYNVGLEASGVRAFDVWKRDRTEFGADADITLGDNVTLAAGGNYYQDTYPGAVAGFTYGWGLQDTSNGSVFAGLTYAKAERELSLWAGYEQYDWNSLQVTKSSQGADYAPQNRWTRESADGLYWIGIEGSTAVGKKGRLRGDVNYQKFLGDWITTNLATNDTNSGQAYPFPESSDSTLTARISFSWEFNEKATFEARYMVEPYRLDDFTIDSMRPYMQGIMQETRASANPLGEMNVTRFLFLDSRYTGYTAHVLSALVHLRF